MALAPRILILGGTGEARALANALSRRGDCMPITSLAGRTRAPMLPAGKVRHGGFGGADGLAAYLDGEAIDLVVDATHPFAAQISRHAEEACTMSGRPRLLLLRPPWQAVDGDRWTSVRTTAEAAARLPELGRRVFLGIGRQDLAAFAGRPGVWYLVRSIEAANDDTTALDAAFIRARGPFDREGETALMREHRIDCLVTRNAGGEATYAKVIAARDLGLPVLMIERPAPPAGEIVENVKAALAWIADRLHLHC